MDAFSANYGVDPCVMNDNGETLLAWTIRNHRINTIVLGGTKWKRGGV